MKFIKQLAVFLFLTLLVISSSVTVLAKEPTVNLRIEGINGNLYHSDLKLSNAQTVADIIASADKISKSLSVTVENGAISQINGETSGSFGSDDGWMLRVNNQNVTKDIMNCPVKANDQIVVYYGSSEMQYPVCDSSKISDGILTFTSQDIVTDKDGKTTVTETAVSGMKVYFDKIEFVTDEKGSITIDKSLVFVGKHEISVSRHNKDGVPTVLRMPPNATIKIAEPTGDTATSDNIQTDAPVDVRIIIAVIIIGVLSVVGGTTIAIKSKV